MEVDRLGKSLFVVMAGFFTLGMNHYLGTFSTESAALVQMDRDQTYDVVEVWHVHLDDTSHTIIQVARRERRLPAAPADQSGR